MKVLEHSPGEFIHEVTLQQEVTTEDAEGLQQKTWSNAAGLIDLPAKINFLTGRELLVAGQVAATYSAEVTIYKPDADVETSMRLVFDGKIYDIVDAIPDNSNQLYITMTIKKHTK
jgi:SPP1 family predicted phage head-tail adaptor